LGNKILTYKKELWSLVINKKEDLKHLLLITPLQNKEKIKKKQLLLKSMDITKWDEIKPLLKKFNH
jgi:hypothetical protein